MLPIPWVVFICQSVWYPSDSMVSSGLRRAVGSQGLHSVCGLLLGEKRFQLRTRLTACIIYRALKPLAAPREASSLCLPERLPTLKSPCLMCYFSCTVNEVTHADTNTQPDIPKVISYDLRHYVHGNILKY